ncbi:EcsC family protein [Clostridium sp. chh4-2]|uniref:EcsC family protein n=1 Tax=Clostridium sp. chh4-2 TaxID=2067550 RepID=UPI000CCF906A|nr:EcsC family protein [Clostridium sp. chh4-2]PNV61534.1 EcsC family protein [Clostridium sp. chh4-2]
MAKSKEQKYQLAVEKELKIVQKQEERLCRSAGKPANNKWKQVLEEKVPDKVYKSLQSVFCKAFSIIFEKGTGIIEKGYKRDVIQENLEVQNFTFQVKANRRSLKKVRSSVSAAHLLNMTITTAEGIGLGVFGIGLPDIVVFVGVLLKGIYEISLHYGFDYDTDEERYFILKLMETAMLREEEWNAGNEAVDRMIAGEANENWNEAVKQQIPRTADAFAVDMVLMKFVQGLPVVGVIGGAGNPFYYNKVMKYAELKYWKRYLLKLQKQ